MDVQCAVSQYVYIFIIFQMQTDREMLTNMSLIRQVLRKNNGVTLLEVSVTVAVISVLAAVAVPNILAWLPGYHLRVTARDMVSLIRRAKLTAVKSNTSVSVFFDSHAHSFFIDNDHSGDLTPGDQTIALHTYQKGIRFGTGTAVTDWNNTAINEPVTIDHNNPADRLIWSSRGMSNTPGSIFIENRNHDICYAVTIQTTGSIRIRKWTGKAWGS